MDTDDISTSDSIVAKAYDHITEDTKFIRLTTITSFIHSMVFLIYIIYSVFFVVVEKQGSNIPVGDIFSFVKDLFNGTNFVFRAIWIVVILGIGYFLLPPIAEASMIYYLDNHERKWTLSIGKGFTKFFPLFEYHGIMSLFDPLTFFIFWSRFWVLGLLGNVFVIIILVIWGLIIFFTSVFLPYTRFIIVLEDKKPMDAIKKSMNLALENLRQSVKFALINYVLYLRAIINILIFLGIPALVIYGATQLDISSQWFIRYIIYIIIALLALLTAYINGIVEAFFTTIWYNIYKKMKN